MHCELLRNLIENLELINDLQIEKYICKIIFDLQIIDNDTKNIEKPKRPG